jgi:SpoVK/Ycf46/Vps4 family AAA+-type ATPase
MLTLLQRFRRNKRSILILATNHVEVFDKAITRPGRFDLVVLVKPPSVSEKIRLWREGRANPSGGLDEEEKIIRSEAALVERFTFDEWATLRQAYNEALASGHSSDELRTLIRKMEAELTIDSQEWETWKDKTSAVR